MGDAKPEADAVANLPGDVLAVLGELAVLEDLDPATREDVAQHIAEGLHERGWRRGESHG